MTLEQLIGQSLGCYKFVSLLAKGETDAIFKAQDIKLMDPEVVEQSDFREQFLQAAHIATHLGDVSYEIMVAISRGDKVWT